MEKKEEQGVYFVKTSLRKTQNQEELIWRIYNSIRNIESIFSCLKTDLDLRPVYHKTDEASEAHLHLGLLAYWIVNTIRHKLKISGINSEWREIVRIMNTQKAVTTVSQNRYDQVIISIRTSDPTPKVQDIYDRLHYKSKPYAKRKFVVHKADFEKLDVFDFRKFVT